MASLYGLKGKITFGSRREQVSIVIIGETTSWKSFPQGSGLQKKLSGTSHELNIGGLLLRKLHGAF